MFLRASAKMMGDHFHVEIRESIFACQNLKEKTQLTPAIFYEIKEQ
jgi:hypothetical protein